jgi:hypothetical protein
MLDGDALVQDGLGGSTSPTTPHAELDHPRAGDGGPTLHPVSPQDEEATATALPSPTPPTKAGRGTLDALLLLEAPASTGVDTMKSTVDLPPSASSTMAAGDTTLSVVTPSPPNAGALAAPAPNKELCRSTRTTSLADAHTLHKAKWLMAKKNLEFTGNSFTTFPDSKVISNLGRVGINLGSSDVAIIKNLEVDRLVLGANQKKSLLKSNTTNFVSDEEREDRLEAVLSHACGNLNENMLDMENDHIIDLSASRRKKKKYKNAKNTNKGKLSKKPNTPSKIIIK